VIVAVDSLRPDHLGCYGYPRPTSPQLDSLAAGGVLFERVIGQASWTTPSFGTILTGLYPSQHGALALNNMLRPTVPTLAALLEARGYATAGIVNAPALSPDYGFARGFDSYDIAEPESRDARETSRLALAWLDRNPGGPFFLFLHYFDAHLPYAPQPGYDRFGDPGYEGAVGDRFDPDLLAPDRETLLASMVTWSAADWDRVKSLYDGEIRSTDQAIGMLLRGLKARGLGRNTLIVFLSDHGQEFFEHGAYGHGHSLYGEVLRVPLVISLEGRLPQGVRVGSQVRLVDVVPTVLDVLGYEGPPDLEGVSLVPCAMGKALPLAGETSVLPRDVAFAEGVRLGGERKALTTATAKIIHDVASGRTLAFGLADDPGEERPLDEQAVAYPRDAAKALLDAVFDMTETWHVEIAAGGEPHVFDLNADAVRGSVRGKIDLVRVVDREGIYHPLGAGSRSEAPGGALEIRGLGVDTAFALVFKSEPRRFPVALDFMVDGRPATEITYLGASLSRADSMPLLQNPGKAACRSRGEPRTRPEPPYVLVWLGGKAYEGDAAASLTEGTKRSLRAVGYMQ
jgi:arylsulfatase A-like enzyme